MVSSVRGKLTYANVVATMALVFAMGGSALAAKHYLITSTSQISPTVLKSIEAKIASKIKPGAEGPAGKEGPVGKEGSTGKEGNAGKEGSTGKEGNAGENGKEGKEGKQGIEGRPGQQGLSELSKAEQEKLKAILPYVSYVPEGLGSKRPTIQFSGVNVQVLSGAGKETEANGKGNIIIGYDEEPGEQTGSNNLVLGSVKQEFTSFGSILGGETNTASGPETVVFGSSNTADGQWSSIDGGEENITKGIADSIAGGLDNEANALQAVVEGGAGNKAEGEYSSIAGGLSNTVAGEYSSVLGGTKNEAGGQWSTIGGGLENTTTNTGIGASVDGGAKNATKENEAWIGGGFENVAEGSYSSIFGGKALAAKVAYEAIP